MSMTMEWHTLKALRNAYDQFDSDHLSVLSNVLTQCVSWPDESDMEEFSIASLGIDDSLLESDGNLEDIVETISDFMGALSTLLRRNVHATIAHNSTETRYFSYRLEAAREFLTEIALAFSLCPIHFCDYAICFDDGASECHMVRVIHPCHDS